ncbi:SCO2522 family protein [Streptomyces sp. NBC_00459]|uniref:SCO2522 family protein n=1 Tax=Streptomyces sp. NBC_00459 TaxID=2975749 RepID=UPI002E16D5DC
MTGVGAEGPGESGWSYREDSAEPPTEQVPYSHLSIELGHLYMEDFAAGPERLRAHFAEVAPWADAARVRAGRKRRVSTCFLVDDYFTRFSSPAQVIPMVTEAAAEAGLRIDYLARESACATADGVEIADLLLARLVAEPPVGSNGRRPPVEESGWLSNGVRSPVTGQAQAMSPGSGWQPPRQLGARRHSVFMDVELWSEEPGGRLWSCPFLAAVWQLLRLGLLRDQGAAVVRAHDWREQTFPDDWAALPPLVRLSPKAAPFAAYRTFSVLASRFLPVEHAVRVILEHTAPDPDALRQLTERAGELTQGMPSGPTERIEYVFTASHLQGGDV